MSTRWSSHTLSTKRRFIEMSFPLHEKTNLIEFFLFDCIWLCIRNLKWRKKKHRIKWGETMFMRFESSRAHLFVNIYVSHDTFCNAFEYIFYFSPFLCFTCRHYTRRLLFICGLARITLITTQRKPKNKKKILRQKRTE